MVPESVLSLFAWINRNWIEQENRITFFFFLLFAKIVLKFFKRAEMECV